MKYLTKEWQHIQDSVLIQLWIRSNKRTNEKDFERLYAEKEKQFIDKEIRELTSDKCGGLSEFKKLLSKYAALDESEQDRFRTEYPALFPTKQSWKFNETLAQKRFRTEFDRKMSLAKELPDEILKEIADIRIFCLGYVTAAVKDKVCTYCAQKWKEKKHPQELAARCTNEASAALTYRREPKARRNLNYEGRILLDVQRDHEDLCLKFNKHWYYNDSTLIIKGGEILEQEDRICRYRKNIYASPCSVVEQMELHRTGERYEFHFLMKNIDREGREKLWYLTFSGSGIEYR